MIKTVKYADINFEKYFECLKNCEQNSDFANQKFLDIVSKKKWFLLVFNDYEAVMPVPFIKKFGISFVIMPKYCHQLGIFSKNDDFKINSLMLKYLEDHFLVANYSFNGDNHFDFKTEKKTSYIIEKNNYDVVKSKFNANRRRNIRITDKLRNEISFETKENTQLKSFFLKNVKGTNGEKDGVVFYNFFELLLKNNFGALKILKFQNNINSFVFLYKGKRRSYLSLFVNQKKSVNANLPSILIDKCLQEYIFDKNFDFVGSDISSIATFNERFGAVPYLYTVIINDRITLFKKLISRYKNN